MRVLSLLLCSFLLPIDAAVVDYTLVISEMRSVPPNSPDCFTDRDMLLVNGTNPGPTLRASVGDTVRVTLINMSMERSVALHFHGISMYGYPYSDGTNLETSCSLPPTETQVNAFVIDARDVGVKYYHGHNSMNRADGFQGALIIDDPNDPDEQALKEQYDDELVIVLQDWYHRSAPSQQVGLDSVPFIWIGNAQSFLINGKGIFEECFGANATDTNCDPGCSLSNYTSAVDVEAGKTYLVHILNIASLVAVNFAIANHTMRVVSADGTQVEPFEVSNLDIGVAQRYSVLLTADQPASSYFIQTVTRFRSGPNGLAYLSYDGSPIPSADALKPEQPAFDDVQAWIDIDLKLKTLNPNRWPDQDVLTSTPNTQQIVVGTQNNDPVTNRLRWAANNVSMAMTGTPTILLAYEAVNAEGAAPWPDTEVPSLVDIAATPAITWNYTDTLQSEGISTFLEMTAKSIYRLVLDDVVEVVMQNALALNGVAEYHGWHLHGHSFWIVGYGNGTFDPETDPASFNLDNPVRRDTLSITPMGWTAIRFKGDNPGAWSFHCSISPHLYMGMGFVYVISPDLLPPPPPGVGSCLQTSLLPADAEVCTLASESSSGSALVTWFAAACSFIGLVWTLV